MNQMYPENFSIFKSETESGLAELRLRTTDVFITSSANCKISRNR